MLIGEGSKEAGDLLEIMYRDMVENSPSVKRMCVPMLLILSEKKTNCLHKNTLCGRSVR